MKLEPGYLHGACTVNTDDRCDVLIAETWGSLEAWLAWENSEARRYLAEQLESLIEGGLQPMLYEEA